MKIYTYSDFTVNLNTETIITDNQLWISIFNPSVSDTFREMALQEINSYIAQHKELAFHKSDSLVCVLQAYMSHLKPSDEKFSILMFIYNEAEGLEKDCIVDIPLQPHESYFQDFKQLVLEELEHLIFNGL